MQLSWTKTDVGILAVTSSKLSMWSHSWLDLIRLHGASCGFGFGEGPLVFTFLSATVTEVGVSK